MDVDTGSAFTADKMHAELRRWSSERLNTAVFSHGHIDHVFGVGLFEAEAEENGWRAPYVVAHENLPRRFDRYVLTAGYNQTVNQRQFGLANLVWPTTYRYPDETYVHDHRLNVGSLEVHLHHEKGETDDATVTWVAEKKVLCTGDLFVWSSPNAGNPQKVQRYPREWAQALRSMAELDVISAVVIPAHLADRPFLQPVYDEPEFIVHNIWRLYGGWWDGNPATLKPANDRRIALEIAELSGGPGRLADRALSLMQSRSPEDERLAGHLIEMAWLAAPEDPGIAAARQRIFTDRAERATSTMAKGVFNWAARESVGDQH